MGISEDNIGEMVKRRGEYDEQKEENIREEEKRRGREEMTI